MTLQDQSKLILAFARVLFVNGQSTDETVAAAEALGCSLGARATVMPRWGELRVDVESSDNSLTAELPADPSGIEMERVAVAMTAIEDIEAGRLAQVDALSKVASLAKTPPAPTWLFTVAAAVGAVALALLFGASHPAAVALIALSAAAGALLRRALARRSTNLFVQPFCAALVAGVVGALAVRYNLSSSLRLVAVCPCMVLLPGAHFLNGALDLANGRIHLGAARFLYALLIVLVISTGLLLGLTLLGVSLPVDPPGRSIPLWGDVLAAGGAIFAYAVFFSMPLKMLPWPVAIGMLAHAAHWATLAILGFGVATAALVACALVGLILTPVSRRWHMPFAAIGFASVVSLMPGIYLFRTASGLTQVLTGMPMTTDLLTTTVADGVTALIVILAMSFGLIVPKLVMDRVYGRQALSNSLVRKEHAHLEQL